MRTDSSPITMKEFGHSVELAKQGCLRSCSGATEAIREALNAIIDADPQDLNQCVRDAYSTYYKEFPPQPIDPTSTKTTTPLHRIGISR